MCGLQTLLGHYGDVAVSKLVISLWGLNLIVYIYMSF